MPWNQTEMELRARFVADAERELFSMAELCARYGVARKTGYKWLARFAAEGAAGLQNRSRRPLSCPHETPDEVVDALIDWRRRFPTWGAKKILDRLAEKRPELALPSRSTACDIFARHGMVKHSRRRPRQGHPGKPTSVAAAPNDTWTTDFKGHFRTRDGIYTYPLTVADLHSRYLLACQSLPSTEHAGVQPVFTRLFREFGLPMRIRSDNGVPFATTGIGRLSRLAVWWLRLGIVPELIEPSSPQQNGAHERMHRTLKQETTLPPAGSARAQQRRFNEFREVYNQERPHEGIGMRTPASVYTASPRPFPEKVPDFEYPSHYELRLVSTNGGIRWKSHWVNVSHVLGGEWVGLEEIDDGVWTLWLGPLEVGRFIEREMKVEDLLGKLKRRERRKVLPMSPD